MATKDCLVDYRMGSTINTMHKTKSDGGKRFKVEGKAFTKKKKSQDGRRAKRRLLDRNQWTRTLGQCSGQLEQLDASSAMILIEPKNALGVRSLLPLWL